MSALGPSDEVAPSTEKATPAKQRGLCSCDHLGHKPHKLAQISCAIKVT